MIKITRNGLKDTCYLCRREKKDFIELINLKQTQTEIKSQKFSPKWLEFTSVTTSWLCDRQGKLVESVGGDTPSSIREVLEENLARYGIDYETPLPEVLNKESFLAWLEVVKKQSYNNIFEIDMHPGLKEEDVWNEAENDWKEYYYYTEELVNGDNEDSEKGDGEESDSDDLEFLLAKNVIEIQLTVELCPFCAKINRDIDILSDNLFLVQQLMQEGYQDLDED